MQSVLISRTLRSRRSIARTSLAPASMHSSPHVNAQPVNIISRYIRALLLTIQRPRALDPCSIKLELVHLQVGFLDHTGGRSRTWPQHCRRAAPSMPPWRGLLALLVALCAVPQPGRCARQEDLAYLPQFTAATSLPLQHEEQYSESPSHTSGYEPVGVAASPAEELRAQQEDDRSYMRMREPAHLTIATRDIKLAGPCAREIGAFCPGARSAYARVAACVQRRINFEDSRPQLRSQVRPEHLRSCHIPGRSGTVKQ